MATSLKLFIRSAYTFTAPVSQLGTGKTVTVKVCATGTGDPSAIGSVTTTATEGASNYTATLSRSTLTSGLSGMVGQSVWVHADDGAAWHVSQEYLVSDKRGFNE